MDWTTFLSLDSVVENRELCLQVSGLDDESLIEEVMFFADKADLEKSTTEILTKFFDVGKLKDNQRKILEAVYVLFHSEKVQEE